MRCANLKVTSFRLSPLAAAACPAIQSSVRRADWLQPPPWASMIIGTKRNPADRHTMSVSKCCRLKRS